MVCRVATFVAYTLEAQRGTVQRVSCIASRALQGADPAVLSRWVAGGLYKLIAFKDSCASTFYMLRSTEPSLRDLLGAYIYHSVHHD